MSASLDERYEFDPENPFLLTTTGSTFGGKADVQSYQDNGIPAYLPSPIIGPSGKPITEEDLPDLRANPDKYTDTKSNIIAIPKEFYSQGIVKPGDPISVRHKGTRKMVMGVAGEIGPSAKNRGVDLPPWMMEELGAETDITKLELNLRPDDEQEQPPPPPPEQRMQGLSEIGQPVQLGSEPVEDLPLSDVGPYSGKLTPVGSNEEEGDIFNRGTGDGTYDEDTSILEDADQSDHQASNDTDTNYTSNGSSGEVSFDPSGLSDDPEVVEERPNGDVVYADGSILHTKGGNVVSIESDGQLVQAIPGAKSLHIVKSSQSDNYTPEALEARAAQKAADAGILRSEYQEGPEGDLAYREDRKHALKKDRFTDKNGKLWERQKGDWQDITPQGAAGARSEMTPSEKLAVVKDARKAYQENPATVAMYGKDQMPGLNTIKTKIDAIYNRIGGKYDNASSQELATYVYQMMKSNDPNSAVLIGEYEAVAHRTGVWDKFSQMKTWAQRGVKVSPAQAADINQTINTLHQAVKIQHFEDLVQRQSKLAEKGLDLSDIDVPVNLALEFEGWKLGKGQAQVGATSGGTAADKSQRKEGDEFRGPDGQVIRFKGGDPNDSNNYEEVK